MSIPSHKNFPEESMMIVELWRRQPGQYFCISTKSASGKWRDTFFSRKELGEVKEFLSENRDKDCYFCVHGLKEASRLKQYAERPKMLWSDMDEVDPRKCKWKPTIAIESSPGRYVGLWFIDTVMTESLNRRLSYAIGADKAGWDLSQVLRVPGTRNYKYVSVPQVRLLWEDGPVYKVKDLEARLPADEGNEQSGLDAAAILSKHKNRIKASTRHELISGKPTQGKRSEVLWRLGNELVEAGLDEDEIFYLLKNSPWNKFKGRASEDDQLRREIVKAVGKKFVAKAPNDQQYKNGYKLLSRTMSEREEKQIDWLWRPYLARGEVTLFEGDPGIGKSYVMQMVAKAICDGDKLPCPRSKWARLPQGKIAYFDMENDASSVTKMRLKWNGCQHMENFYQEEEPFTLDDLEARNHMFEALERVRPTMVVFDTLNLYIGHADIAKANEATQALAIFKQIATQFHCSVVIVRHLTKSGGVKALYRGQGNIAISAMPRIILTIGSDPEDEEVKALCHTKLSFARRPGGIRFTIDELPDTLRESDRSKLTWGEYDQGLHSEDIISVEGKKGRTSEERDAAQEFLEEALDDGPKRRAELEIMAEKRSISIRTLERAAEALGVMKKLTGFGAGKASIWELARMTKNE
jgi:hypothetical protein